MRPGSLLQADVVESAVKPGCTDVVNAFPLGAKKPVAMGARCVLVEWSGWSGVMEPVTPSVVRELFKDAAIVAAHGGADGRPPRFPVFVSDFNVPPVLGATYVCSFGPFVDVNVARNGYGNERKAPQPPAKAEEREEAGATPSWSLTAEDAFDDDMYAAAPSVPVTRLFKGFPYGRHRALGPATIATDAIAVVEREATPTATGVLRVLRSDAGHVCLPYEMGNVVGIDNGPSPDSAPPRQPSFTRPGAVVVCDVLACDPALVAMHGGQVPSGSAACPSAVCVRAKDQPRDPLVLDPNARGVAEDTVDRSCTFWKVRLTRPSVALPRAPIAEPSSFLQASDRARVRPGTLLRGALMLTPMGRLRLQHVQLETEGDDGASIPDDVVLMRVPGNISQRPGRGGMLEVAVRVPNDANDGPVIATTAQMHRDLLRRQLGRSALPLRGLEVEVDLAAQTDEEAVGDGAPPFVARRARIVFHRTDALGVITHIDALDARVALVRHPGEVAHIPIVQASRLDPREFQVGSRVIVSTVQVQNQGASNSEKFAVRQASIAALEQSQSPRASNANDGPSLFTVSGSDNPASAVPGSGEPGVGEQANRGGRRYQVVAVMRTAVGKEAVSMSERWHQSLTQQEQDSLAAVGATGAADPIPPSTSEYLVAAARPSDLSARIETARGGIAGCDKEALRKMRLDSGADILRRQLALSVPERRQILPLHQRAKAAVADGGAPRTHPVRVGTAWQSATAMAPGAVPTRPLAAGHAGQRRPESAGARDPAARGWVAERRSRPVQPRHNRRKEYPRPQRMSSPSARSSSGGVALQNKRSSGRTASYDRHPSGPRPAPADQSRPPRTRSPLRTPVPGTRKSTGAAVPEVKHSAGPARRQAADVFTKSWQSPKRSKTPNRDSTPRRAKTPPKRGSTAARKAVWKPT
jgi:hypothetical protein